MNAARRLRDLNRAHAARALFACPAA